MLTRTQIASLSSEIRRVRGRCYQKGGVLAKWLAANLDADPREAAFFCAVVGSPPFPPIHGPKPSDRSRPYFDDRFRGEWANDDA